MVITKKICDSCGKEVKWLYDMPDVLIEGKTINVYDRTIRQLCIDCATKVLYLYRNLKPGTDDTV